MEFLEKSKITRKCKTLSKYLEGKSMKKPVKPKREVIVFVEDFGVEHCEIGLEELMILAHEFCDKHSVEIDDVKVFSERYGLDSFIGISATRLETEEEYQKKVELYETQLKAWEKYNTSEEKEKHDRLMNKINKKIQEIAELRQELSGLQNEL